MQNFGEISSTFLSILYLCNLTGHSLANRTVAIQTIKVFYHRWKSIALLELLFSVLGINCIFYIIAIAIDYLVHKALWYTPLQACYWTVRLQNSNQSPAHLIFDSLLSSASCELWDCLQLHMTPRDTMILIIIVSCWRVLLYYGWMFY